MYPANRKNGVRYEILLVHFEKDNIFHSIMEMEKRLCSFQRECWQLPSKGHCFIKKMKTGVLWEIINCAYIILLLIFYTFKLKYNTEQFSLHFLPPVPPSYHLAKPFHATSVLKLISSFFWSLLLYTHTDIQNV